MPIWDSVLITPPVLQPPCGSHWITTIGAVLLETVSTSSGHIIWPHPMEEAVAGASIGTVTAWPGS